jgi:hypothetical protein
VKIALALIAALLLAFAAPAAARIVVLDPATGAAIATPVHDDAAELLGWTDDAAALIVRGRGGVRRVDVATGASSPQPALDAATAVGPGGRWIGFGRRPGRRVPIELHAADGRLLATLGVSTSGLEPDVAWARDGSRVAVAASSRLVVADTASGAVLRRVELLGVQLGAQTFAPDASAVVVSDSADASVQRIDVGSGARSVLFRPRRSLDTPQAAWGNTGRIAVTTHDGVRVLDVPPVVIPVDVLAYEAPAGWTPDGRAILYPVGVRAPRCATTRSALELRVPGEAPRTLLGPIAAQIFRAQWAADGHAVAVELGQDFDKRGRRHPWPKRIRHDFAMLSKRGDTAMRRVVVHASRALRRGAGRARTMVLVSDEYERVAKRFDEALDTEVGEALAGELSKWLRAAGFEEIDGRDELEC